MSRKECIFAVLLLSVQAVAQGVPVVQNPTANQSIVQPPGATTGTAFSTNNEAGILYVVPSYNWSQSFLGSLNAGTHASPVGQRP